MNWQLKEIHLCFDPKHRQLFHPRYTFQRLWRLVSSFVLYDVKLFAENFTTPFPLYLKRFVMSLTSLADSMTISYLEFLPLIPSNALLMSKV